MISRNILTRLVPLNAPDVDLPPAIAELVADDDLLTRLALWSQLVREDLEHLVRSGDASETIPLLVDSEAVGIGIFYAAGDAPTSDDFPAVQGYCFGLSIYRPRSLVRGEYDGEPRRANMRLTYNEYQLPVATFSSDFVAHFHPRRGRSSAMVDIGGSLYLVTARHVVDHLKTGQSVDLSCVHGSNKKSILIAKAPGPFDAALLEPLDSFKLCVPQTQPTAIPPVQGLTVSGHFGSNMAPQTATVLQALSSPQGISSAVQPHTFLIDTTGFPGDSGSAVSSVLDAEKVMVGMYLGASEIEGNGIQKSVGLALEIQQTLRIFKADLIGGILQ
jgi:hypothetical protein